jgi:hypothetical protein
MQRIERSGRILKSTTSIALSIALVGGAACGPSSGVSSPTGEAGNRPQASPSTSHPVDEFHPDRAPRADGTRPPMPKPAYGGRAILHLQSMPRSLNGAIDGSGIVRRIGYEVNETLLLRNWDTLALEPDVCTDWIVEDQVVRKGAKPGDAMPFGRVTEDAYV